MNLLEEYYQAMVDFSPDHHRALLILLYHGVTDHASSGIENCSGKHISSGEFRRQMAFAKEHCTLLTVEEVVDIHHRGARYPSNAVLISFDDGFENNFTVAAPILRELEIPAVFYVSTGLIGTERMFWVDQIEDCINRSTKESISVRLEQSRKFPLGNRNSRLVALNEIKAYCKRATALEKDRVIQELIRVSAVDPSPTASPNYRVMTWEQLHGLASASLFTIGAHTVNHNVLSSLRPGDVEYEVGQSIKHLNHELGIRVRHFSYPEGQAHHYNESVIRTLKKHGIVCCPSAIPGMNNWSMGLFHLRRVMVGFMGVPFPYWDKRFTAEMTSAEC